MIGFSSGTYNEEFTALEDIHTAFHAAIDNLKCQLTALMLQVCRAIMSYAATPLCRSFGMETKETVIFR